MYQPRGSLQLLLTSVGLQGCDWITSLELSAQAICASCWCLRSYQIIDCYRIQIKLLCSPQANAGVRQQLSKNVTQYGMPRANIAVSKLFARALFSTCPFFSHPLRTLSIRLKLLAFQRQHRFLSFQCCQGVFLRAESVRVALWARIMIERPGNQGAAF